MFFLLRLVPIVFIVIHYEQETAQHQSCSDPPENGSSFAEYEPPKKGLLWDQNESFPFIQSDSCDYCNEWCRYLPIRCSSLQHWPARQPAFHRLCEGPSRRIAKRRRSRGPWWRCIILVLGTPAAKESIYKGEHLISFSWWLSLLLGSTSQLEHDLHLSLTL